MASRWALTSMKRWLEHGVPAACASAAARNQPVTPPICCGSGITRSEAPSDSASSISYTPLKFSPIWIGVVTCVAISAAPR